MRCHRVEIDNSNFEKIRNGKKFEVLRDAGFWVGDTLELFNANGETISARITHLCVHEALITGYFIVGLELIDNATVGTEKIEIKNNALDVDGKQDFIRREETEFY